MPSEDDDKRFGVRLRGGLPASNGLAPLSETLIGDTSKVIYFVASARVATVIHNTENDSKTASMKLLGLEADLLPSEISAIQLVLDRARSRRTGEAPLFDIAGMPEDPQVVLADPKARPLKSVPAGRKR